MDDLIHISFDFFNAMRYVFSNITSLMGVLFVPLSWIFNFLKGFFAGVATPPPTTAINWVFPDNVVAVFNAIPYFSTLTYACGAGISILLLVFIFRRLTEF